MNKQDVKIGLEVVRSVGDYVVGRTGNVINIDNDKGRAQVAWHRNNKTWVSFASIEPTSIPYEIKRVNKTDRWSSYHRI